MNCPIMRQKHEWRKKKLRFFSVFTEILNCKKVNHNNLLFLRIIAPWLLETPPPPSPWAKWESLQSVLELIVIFAGSWNFPSTGCRFKLSSLIKSYQGRSWRFFKIKQTHQFKLEPDLFGKTQWGNITSHRQPRQLQQANQKSRIIPSVWVLFTQVGS